MGALLDFWQEYRSKEVNYNELPPVITHNYNLCACLKLTEHKQVYLIQGKEDAKKYILKCISSNSHENLQEEYKLHHSLIHEGLVPAVDFIKGEEDSYFIREYIEGNTIAELVEMTKEGYLSDDELVGITLQLCHVLEYLHMQNPPIIHRDIKPDNIIYSKQKECKLIDFGISRRFTNNQEKDTVIMGTEFTAPPEQFGYKQTDARSDIYSLGVLMFYMATGSLDIREINDYSISKNIKKCIKKSTEFSPEDRYETVKQLKTRLLQYNTHNGLKMMIASGIFILLLTSLFISSYQTISANDRKLKQQEMADLQEATEQQEITEQQNESLQLKESNVTELENTKVIALGDENINSNASEVVPYVFTSSLIEDAVRHELGITESDIIALKDLELITELYICGEQVYDTWWDHFVYGKLQYMHVQEYVQSGRYNNQGDISSLVDLAYMKNLQTLALYKQNISDLSPLVNLTNLTCLGLGTNNISDISILSQLSNIITIDLSGNPIINSDMTALSRLTYLKNLDLGDTGITELSTIKKMKLQSLSLWNNQIMDCEGIENMTGLEALIITGVGNGITEKGLSNIVKLSNLKELRIMGGTFSDISVLSKLTNLIYLDLCACKIYDLKGLEGMKLTTLLFDCTPVNDLRALDNFSELTSLGIRDIPCKEYESLLLLPELQNVSCNKEQAMMIQDQLGEVPFAVIIQ